MNKLLSFTGGQPFLLDDLDFVQASIADAFSGIFSFLDSSGSNGIILSGVFLSFGTTTTWSPGYILLDGEVLKVDAGSLTTPTQNAYWVLSQTYDPAGNKLFQNGTTHDTYEIRKATLVHLSAPDATKMKYNAKTFKERLAADLSISYLVSKALVPWSEANSFNSFQNNWANKSNTINPAYPHLQIRITGGGMDIRGRIVNTSFASGSEVVLRLNVKNPLFPVPIIAMDMNNFGSAISLTLDTNGDIRHPNGPYTSRDLWIPEQTISLEN